MSLDFDSAQLSCRAAAGAELWLLGQHLGLAADLSPRVSKMLRQATLCVFEEDRPARQTLKQAGIERPYLRLSEHAQPATLRAVAATLALGGTVTYMSDHGTPGIADPGQALVRLAYQMGARLRQVPGPSAPLSAVAACPFATEQFIFAGLPPRDPQQRRLELRHWAKTGLPVVLLDTPYRLLPLLRDAAASWDPQRRGFLAFEISSEYERYHCGAVSELERSAAAQLDGVKNRRNFVLILEGSGKIQPQWPVGRKKASPKGGPSPLPRS